MDAQEHDANPYQSPESSPEPVTPEIVEEVPPKPWGFWATMGFSAVVLTAFIAIQTAVFLGFLVVWQMERPDAEIDELLHGGQTNGLYVAAATVVGAIPCFLLAALFAWLRRGWSVAEYFALRRVSGRTMLFWLAVLALFIVATELLNHFLDREIPEFMVYAYQTAGVLPLFLLAIVVVAPLFEELFFRGFMFRGLQASIGGAAATLITAGIWAVIHLQYDSFEVGIIFALGVLFGISRIRTGSIVPCIGMHCAMNLAAMAQVMWHFGKSP